MFHSKLQYWVATIFGKIFFVKLENFEKISKIAKTQDFERI